MLRVGELDIAMINDGTILSDAGGPFGLVPKTLWSAKFMPPVRDNLLPMTHMNLVVKTGGQTIVIDTGHGIKDTAKLERIFHLDRSNGDVVAGLARMGIAPEDVDLVINTHLHYDHCGGNTFRDEGGSIQPTFPNAEYVVQRREYEDAMQPNERTRATYVIDNYAPLVERGQMRLLDGDTELVPGIRGVVTPGHTPGHMSVLFESAGEYGLFVCDMSSYAIHMERLGWMTAYDVEPLVTLETKRHWQNWAVEHDALLIFAHDPQRHAGRLQDQDNGKRVVVPVEVTLV